MTNDNWLDELDRLWADYEKLSRDRVMYVHAQLETHARELIDMAKWHEFYHDHKPGWGDVIKKLTTERDALQGEVERLRENAHGVLWEVEKENKELRELLRKVEWIQRPPGHGGMIIECHFCGATSLTRFRAKHAPDCELAVALGEK